MRKTVLATPLMDCSLAPFASEVAAGNVPRRFLGCAINRLARQATEKKREWSLVRHRSLHNVVVTSLGCDWRQRATEREPSRWLAEHRMAATP
jgi:hypothetical protein